MTGMMTWEQISFIFGLMGTLAGIAGFLWLRVESARKNTRAELVQERQMTQAQIDSLRNELTGFRIRVAESYATYDAMKTFDERIGEGLSEIRAQVDALRNEVMKLAASR